MKKTTKVVLSVFAIAISSVIVSEMADARNNPAANNIDGNTGSPSDGNDCTSCHNQTNMTVTANITSNIPSSGFISGQTYTITASVSSSGKTKYGFEVSPQNKSNGNIIGAIANINATTNIRNGSKYITHSNNNWSGTWSFKWTAPGSATATSGLAANSWYFYGSFLTTNAGNNQGGDNTKDISVTFPENTTVSDSIFASAKTICAGSSVTFTVVPTNGGGSSPTYQWNINGSAAPGTNNAATYTSTSLNQGDVVTCILTSNKSGVTYTSGSSAISNSITMTVNSLPTITSVTSGKRCDAGTVNLSAKASAGIVNWYTVSSGGTAVATGNNYTTPSLSSTTYYYLDATYNGCTSAYRVADTAIVNNTPAIPTAGSNSPVCEGDNILLNSSASVSYNWTGPNSFTSTIQNPAIGSATQAMAGTYSVTATQNGCTSAAGTTTVLVNSPSAPVASIAVTGGSSTSCIGQSITFSVSPTNGGSNPTYQWLVNNAAAPGTSNNSTYSYNNFNNNDTVSCILTSNATCITTTVDTSNIIVISITSPLTPSVSIAVTSGSNPSCNGQIVTFTASPTYGGSSPTYLWQVNGLDATGTNNASTYSSSSLSDQDKVTCILTSNASCLTTNVDTSAAITMSISSSIFPTVSIAVSSGSTTICQGQSVQFDAVQSGGGSNPTYQWTLDGLPAGTNSSTYGPEIVNDGQQIACTMTSSSGCANPTTVNSGTLTMVVTPTVTPTITINGLNTICAGAAATYTVSASNQGSNANFDWRVNGVSAQSGSSTTFSSLSLANNDAISCVLTPIAATCASPSFATSNTINVGVTPIANPSASIAITGGSNPSCIAQPVTFSVTVTDEGSAPTYQWQVNGANAGGTDTGITYSSSNLTDNDTITCILTSNAACAASFIVTSNKIGMTVTSAFTPSLSISGSTSVCEGQAVIFTAAPYGGGATPSYQWQLDGVSAGTDSPTYGPVTLNDGQTIACTMTSSSSCANPTTAASNTLTMIVTPTVTPSVSIKGLNSICAGTVVTFTASVSNPGSNPSYQWKLNGNPVGINDTIYALPNNLTNNSVITCVFTSNAACATTSTIIATPITMNVTPTVNPSIQIVPQFSSPLCSTSNASFQAIPSGGGSAPGYQWLVNAGAAPGAVNSSLYMSSVPLGNADVVTCKLTSNAACAITTTVSSSPFTMSITAAVTPSVNIVASATSIRAGTSVTYTATPTYGGSSPNYQWRVDNISVGAATSNNIYTSSALTDGQVISCVLTSDNTCQTQATTNSNAIAMTVISPPVLPTISKTINSSDVLLTSSAISGNQWYYNGILIPGATAKTYTATQNGVYYLIVTNNTTVLQSAPVGIAVPVSIAQNGNVLTSSSTSGNQWYIDGLAIPDSIGQTITVTQNGYYSVVVNINGVSSSATPVLINSFSSSPTATGINQLTSDNTIRISPSPNDGNFKISFDVTVNATYSLEIKDLLGQLIYSEILSSFSGSYDKQLSLSGYGKGVYIISLTSTTLKTINKIVVY